MLPSVDRVPVTRVAPFLARFRSVPGCGPLDLKGQNMPIVRSSPVVRSSGARALRPGSLRARLFALALEEGTAAACAEAPLSIADLALSLDCPQGKELGQWKAEIGSVLSTDLKDSGILSTVWCRTAPGLFGVVPAPVEAEG